MLSPRRTHLSFLLRDLDAHILAQDETGDALVSLGGVNIGEDLRRGQCMSGARRRVSAHEESVRFTGV